MLLLNKFRIIYSLMLQSDRKRLAVILLISVANGLFNVIGIASILPFIGVITEPDLINTQKEILLFSEITGIDSYGGIILTFGSVSFFLILFGNILDGLDIWIANRFGLLKEQQLSARLLATYLNADDQVFNRQKNAERAKYVLADIDRVILDSLFAMLSLFSSIVIAVFIFLLLLVVDPQVTLVISAAILVVYFLVYGLASKRLDRLGREFADLETEIYDEVLQALKLQREIKLAQKQHFFLGRYTRAFAKTVKNRLKYELFSLIPQRVIEVVAYGGIIIIAIYFSLAEQSNYTAVTLIGMYAFATYRLMPAVSDIFDSFEKIQFGSAILKRLVAEFDLAAEFDREAPDQESGRKPLTTLSSREGESEATHHNNPAEKIQTDADTGLSNWRQLTLHEIDFSFAGEQTSVIQKLNLTFEAGQFYCIKGSTGCGKSTLLNILAGLYQPTGGQILLDERPLTFYHNRQWHASIGYVPADVKLINGTLCDNIALGVDPERVDLTQINRVLKIVAFDDKLDELSAGIDTRLGDGGVSLSSGQTQKIGLARALYRNPAVLLLDESTDAFDLATEQRVLERLRESFPVTFISVSHRPSVMTFADQVIDLEQLLHGIT